MNDTLQGITHDFAPSRSTCHTTCDSGPHSLRRPEPRSNCTASSPCLGFSESDSDIIHMWVWNAMSHVLDFYHCYPKLPSSSWSLRLIERECFEWGSLHWFYSNLIIQITCFLKHVFFVKQVSAKIFRGRSPERWSSTSQRPPLPSRTKPEFLESYYRSKVCFHIAMKPHPTHCQQQCNQSWYLEVWKETTGPRERCLLKFRFSTDTKHLRVMWSTLPGFGSSVLSPKLWSFQCKYAQYITIYIYI